MRKGFSRVDLLAVVFVLGLGAGIAVPAVHQADAKQERATSSNNLKQMVLATHNVHDVYKKFPQISGVLAGHDATLHFQLLPFMEQGPAYQAGDLAASIKVMQNPGDRSAPAGGVYKKVYGTTNYAGNWLVFKGGPQAPGFGTMLQITDGTSNTIMYTERYQMCSGTPCLWGYSQYYYWAPMFAYFSLGKFQIHPPQESCNPALPQSTLREGIQIGMCDGSIQLAGNKMSCDTWACIVHPSDGKPFDWDN